MSTITTYPLDNIDYNAADVAAYNAPRTSGVYSAEDDFSVTAAGGLDVAVSSGIAWVRPERFAGYSVCFILCQRQHTRELLFLGDVVRFPVNGLVFCLPIWQTHEDIPRFPALLPNRIIFSPNIAADAALVIVIFAAHKIIDNKL